MLLKLAAVGLPAEIGVVDCLNYYIVVVRRFVFVMHVSPSLVTMIMLMMYMHPRMELQVGCIISFPRVFIFFVVGNSFDL